MVTKCKIASIAFPLYMEGVTDMRGTVFRRLVNFSRISHILSSLSHILNHWRQKVFTLFISHVVQCIFVKQIVL